jgi:hypothetical protein
MRRRRNHEWAEGEGAEGWAEGGDGGVGGGVGGVEGEGWVFDSDLKSGQNPF